MSPSFDLEELPAADPLNEPRKKLTSRIYSYYLKNAFAGETVKSRIVNHLSFNTIEILLDRMNSILRNHVAIIESSGVEK